MTPDLYTYRAFVSGVYDGDSITVDIDCGFYVTLRGQKVRLLRIDAPEIRGEEREQGLITRDVLREKILGKWVLLRTEKDSRGKYGRWLGEIWIEDECVNDWLLTEGLAQPYGE